MVAPTLFLFSGYTCNTWSDITIAGFVIGIQMDVTVIIVLIVETSSI